MKLITYAEAAEILDVSIQTLKQALEPDRKALTRAGRRGTNGLLIEEQVRLFTGVNPRTGKKKRLSLNALTKEEQALWKGYADELTAPEHITVDEGVKKTLAEMVKEELARQQIARIRAEEAEDERKAKLRQAEKERIYKENQHNPFLLRELMTA